MERRGIDWSRQHQLFLAKGAQKIINHPIEDFKETSADSVFNQMQQQN